MITQHTPGPWHWEADEVKGDPFGRIRYQVTALGKTVTRIFYSSFEGGPTNADADARLIAAAPDLLAACKALQMEAAARGCGLRIADEAIQKATEAKN